jgi:hypothetical protein
MSTLSLNPSSHFKIQDLHHAHGEEEILEPFQLLNQALELIAKMRSKQEVDPNELHAVVDKLNQTYPGMETYDFLHNHTTYSDEDWHNAERWIVNKQKELIQHHFPHAKLEKPAAVEAPKLSPYRDIHPGYLIIDVGDKYEKKQIELIVKHDAENKKTIGQLNVLNDALNLMLALRDKQTVNPEELKNALAKLNSEFPDLQFQDFLEKHASFGDKEWNHAQERITNKQKILMSLFNPKMMEIEELIGDKNKVHEIISDIIKQLNELGHFIVQKTGK